MFVWSPAADKTLPRLRRVALLTCLAASSILIQQPAMAADEQMRFVVVRSSQAGCEPTCTEWISAEGMIGPRTPTLLKATLRTLGDRKLPLVLTSPGGDMAAAMAIGRLIRRNGLGVAVGMTVFEGCEPDDEGCRENDNRGADYVGEAVSEGRCAHACALVLAAGVRRLAGDGTAVEDIPIGAASEAGTKKLVAYYGEMGVRHQVLVEGLRDEDGNLGHWQLFKALLVTSTLAVDQLVDAQICRGTPAPDNCRVFTTMDLE
ncbi:hypothetical protein [Ensifer adhaerens]|nr:hypothetical protein [Ensifer adhaerens]